MRAALSAPLSGEREKERERELTGIITLYYFKEHTRCHYDIVVGPRELANGAPILAQHRQLARLKCFYINCDCAITLINFER